MSIIGTMFAGVVLAQEVERRPFQPADVHRIKTVGDIALSPDGEWMVYQALQSLNVPTQLIIYPG